MNSFQLYHPSGAPSIQSWYNWNHLSRWGAFRFFSFVLPAGSRDNRRVLRQFSQNSHRGKMPENRPPVRAYRQNKKARHRFLCDVLRSAALSHGQTQSGRGDWIRTSGLYVPNVALYQTEPHLEMAAEEGFEPSQTESESAVLPLHNSAISESSCRRCRTTIFIISKSSCLSTPFFGISKIIFRQARGEEKRIGWGEGGNDP